LSYGTTAAYPTLSRRSCKLPPQQVVHAMPVRAFHKLFAFTSRLLTSAGSSSKLGKTASAPSSCAGADA